MKLNWNGLRILNTRPMGQQHQLSQKIRDEGGVPVECPALAIEPIDNNEWRELEDLASFDWAIFISVNAVDCALKYLPSWPLSIRIAAIGQTTADALIKQGLQVDIVPSSANSEALLNEPLLQAVRGKKVLLIKGEDGRSLIADTLNERGALVKPLVVYRRVCPHDNAEKMVSLRQHDGVDAIIFTSEAAMHHLIHLVGIQGEAWLKSKPCYVKSHRLAEVAKKLDFVQVYVADV